MIDYIAGEKFEELCKTSNFKNLIFRRIDEVNELFHKPPKDAFILVSHNGSSIITDKPEDPGVYTQYIPDTLKMWFGQNVCAKHDRLKSIPLGVENSEWHTQLRKRHVMNNASSMRETIRKNLVYANFNIETNRSERQYAYDCVRNHELCTIDMRGNGYDFDSYVYNMVNHGFVLCPEGKGPDTCRLWETLYVGSIPVVKRGINVGFYSELPILVIDDWSEAMDVIMKTNPIEFKNRKWNMRMLEFEYWRETILEECRKNKLTA